MKQRRESQMRLWDWFDDFMEEHGYDVLVHNDEYTGRGSVAYRDDKFAPLFSLHVWGGEIAENFVSIHIQDRNGSSVLTGETAAIYSMVDTGDKEKNLVVFSKMVNDAYEKYRGYSKTNRLDFVFNQMKEDRKVYDENCLLLEGNSGGLDVLPKNNVELNDGIPVTTIYFTTTEGPDATQFDTHDVRELLGLFHGLLVESGLTLVSVDGVEQGIDNEGLARSSVDELVSNAEERSGLTGDVQGVKTVDEIEKG